MTGWFGRDGFTGVPVQRGTISGDGWTLDGSREWGKGVSLYGEFQFIMGNNQMEPLTPAL